MGTYGYAAPEYMVTGPKREEFIAILQQVEDWLYEYGDDETKGVNIAKLEELKKRGNSIEVRFKEHSERGAVIDQLVSCINSYREAAMSNDPKFDHIEVAEKQKVLSECVEAEAWLREKQQQQESLPKHSTPAILSDDARKKAEALDRFCRPIMTKPKPVKPATPKASPTPSQWGDHPQGVEKSGSPNKDSNENAAETEAPPVTGEPMETEKSETDE